jgi:hypothetical protein
MSLKKEMPHVADVKSKESGFTVSYCLGRAGIGLVVFGVLWAGLDLYGIEQPFVIGVVVMMLGVTALFTLAMVWVFASAFKTLNVLLLVVCTGLAVYHSIRSVVIPLLDLPPGSPFFPLLVRLLFHSPALLYLGGAVALAVLLIKQKSRDDANPNKKKGGHTPPS